MSSSECGHSSQLVVWEEGDLFSEGPCGQNPREAA